MIKQSVIFQDLGRMDYQSAWDYQEQLLQENVRKKSVVYRRESVVQSPNSDYETQNSEVIIQNSELQTQNYLLFVEHPPVFTLGKSGNINNVLLSEERLKERGIEFFRTNRGGDITFHGPEQIVES